MATDFSVREFKARKQLVLKEMENRHLDGLLMFRQESMYYLSGLHTFGYCFFQVIYLHTDGHMTLLTRLPDVHSAKLTTILTDIREWRNLPDANPAVDLKKILKERGCSNKRIGIELDAYGLTALNYRKVDAALNGFCRLEDASDLITGIRTTKSRKELMFCRKAGQLADAALTEANQLAVPGAWEGDILAAMQGAVFKGDGDYSGNEFIINSGPKALVGRYFTGRRHLGQRDQLTIEWAGVYRFYHAAMMRTILTGKPSRHQLALHQAAVEAHLASVEKLKPGNTFGDVFTAYERTAVKHGYRYLGATGYSLGSTFPPTWMDWPMFWKGNDEPIKKGMVLFIHTLISSKNGQNAQAPGQTYIVTDQKPESLSKMPLELIANA